MKTYTLYFTSFNGKGRNIRFTLNIEAANDRDAATVGERMTEVLGWSLDGVLEAT